MPRKITVAILSLLAVGCLAGSLLAQTLQKKADHVYIATFNVYKLGAVADKYSEAEEEIPELTPGIPDRITKLSNVLAVGSFDLVVLEEVAYGPRGEAAMTDLVAALEADHSLHYSFFLSDHIGQGLIPEAIAFMYDPSVVRPELLPGTPSLVQNIPVDGRDLVRTQWEAAS